MLKKMQKYDYIFICALICVLIFHFFSMYTPMPYDDEAIYPTGPLRFINGDIMMQHEWHLSQFSSMFSHLPVLIWLMIKGSTEGLIFFLRICYLVLHTFAAVVIYRVFRNYKAWAIIAAVMYYTQTAYRMMAISYISMIVFFLLLFEIVLFFIYKRAHNVFYIIAGVLFGACCVCNPLFCVLYPLYLIVCLICNKNVKNSTHSKHSSTHVKKKKKTAVIKDEKQMVFNKYFSKKAMLLFSCGIGIMAVISVIYFFSTGATFSTFFDNFTNLISASEYDVFNSIVAKFKEISKIFVDVSMHVPFLLPCLFLALLFDKKRKDNKHKIAYVISALVISIIYVCGVTTLFVQNFENAYALSLPFGIFSTVCYILTENKNKTLFYCIWIPSMIGGVLQCIATNTGLTAPFALIAIENIAGVFFVCDFWREMKIIKRAPIKNKSIKVKNNMLVCGVLCFAIIIQLGFNCFLQMYDRVPNMEVYTKVTYGPFKNLYLDEDYYDKYTKGLADLDVIKSLSNEDEPVLITSRMGWMHLYIDRPCASYCAALFALDSTAMTSYYEQNPEKVPKYIYVSFAQGYYLTSREYAQQRVAELKKLFRFEQKELSMGYLLTVKNEYL